MEEWSPGSIKPGRLGAPEPHLKVRPVVGLGAIRPEKGLCNSLLFSSISIRMLFTEGVSNNGSQLFLRRSKKLHISEILFLSSITVTVFLTINELIVILETTLQSGSLSV
jgi:hypothetical protein